MKGKKGMSMLVIGLFFFFFMGSLYLMTVTTIGKITFNEITGNDAQRITTRDYELRSWQFLYENFAFQYFKESQINVLKDSPEDIFFDHNQNKYIILEKDEKQYYSKIRRLHYGLIEKNFNEKLLEIEKTGLLKFYNADPSKSEEEQKPLRYSLLFENDKIHGFPNKITTRSFGTFFMWTPFSIDYSDEFEQEFSEVIRLRQISEICLMRYSKEKCVEYISGEISVSDLQMEIEENSNEDISKTHKVEIFLKKMNLNFYMEFYMNHVVVSEEFEVLRHTHLLDN